MSSTIITDMSMSTMVLHATNEVSHHRSEHSRATNHLCKLRPSCFDFVFLFASLDQFDSRLSATTPHMLTSHLYRTTGTVLSVSHLILLIYGRTSTRLIICTSFPSTPSPSPLTPHLLSPPPLAPQCQHKQAHITSIPTPCPQCADLSPTPTAAKASQPQTAALPSAPPKPSKSHQPPTDRVWEPPAKVSASQRLKLEPTRTRTTGSEASAPPPLEERAGSPSETTGRAWVSRA
jgi:hypothetical protein